MKKYYIFLLGLMLILFGCVTYPSYRLTPSSYSEAQEVLLHFNVLSLKNQYSLQILSKEEMQKLIKGGVPHIDTNKNIIYIEDLYLKYLYNHRGGKFYHIRKRDLACIIAHEICHKEYNLPDKPLEVHLQVDEKAIGLLNKFGIDWHDYAGALIRANDYLKTRGGDFVGFARSIPNIIGVSSALYLGVGFFTEEDLETRFYIISQHYGGQNWYSNRELNRRTSSDFTRKTDWDFN